MARAQKGKADLSWDWNTDAEAAAGHDDYPVHGNQEAEEPHQARNSRNRKGQPGGRYDSSFFDSCKPHNGDCVSKSEVEEPVIYEIVGDGEDEKDSEPNDCNIFATIPKINKYTHIKHYML